MQLMILTFHTENDRLYYIYSISEYGKTGNVRQVYMCVQLDVMPQFCIMKRVLKLQVCRHVS